MKNAVCRNTCPLPPQTCRRHLDTEESVQPDLPLDYIVCAGPRPTGRRTSAARHRRRSSAANATRGNAADPVALEDEEKRRERDRGHGGDRHDRRKVRELAGLER